MTTDTSLEQEPSPQVQRTNPLTRAQWTILIVMAIFILAIIGTLVWVLRAGVGMEPGDMMATAIAGPPPTKTPPSLVPGAVSTSDTLYMPPDPLPLATPHAPSDLLWWDARFAYRQPIVFDAVAADMPAGTWARVLFDGEQAQREGKMRQDGADLRVLVWDGVHWWQLERDARPCSDQKGWEVLFHVQSPQVVEAGGYYLYFGHPFAGTPPVARDAPETSRLLLALGAEEGVEWGPEITWTANSTTTQTLVSADGRIIISSPAGGLKRTVQVQLRIVPMQEKHTSAALPDFELHAEPPPAPLGHSNIIRWNPPLQVTINWAGLPIDQRDLENWVHFAYDEDKAIWYNVPVEFDRVHGITRVTTEQP